MARSMLYFFFSDSQNNMLNNQGMHLLRLTEFTNRIQTNFEYFVSVLISTDQCYLRYLKYLLTILMLSIA